MMFSAPDPVLNYVLLKLSQTAPGSYRKTHVQTSTSHLVFEVGEQVVFPVICGHAAVGKHLDVGLHKAHKHLCVEDMTQMFFA